MLCLKILKCFHFSYPTVAGPTVQENFSRMPWNFAQKEYQVSEKSQTSKLFKKWIRWNFLTLNFLFSNHEKLSPAFLKFHLQKIAAEDNNWKNAQEPSALVIMFEDCSQSEIQHLTSSVKRLVKCYIYYDL